MDELSYLDAVRLLSEHLGADAQAVLQAIHSKGYAEGVADGYSNVSRALDELRRQARAS